VPVFLDTNVLVSAFDRSDAEKRAAAQRLLADESDFAISAQVLSEFYVVTTKKLNPSLSHAEAVSAIDLLRNLPVVAVDDGLVATAIKTAHSSRISLRDAQIVEAAVHAGCHVLLTEDLNAGQVISGVEVKNPFS